MKPSDVKPHMIFFDVRTSWRRFTVEQVVDEAVKGCTWGHLGPPTPAVLSLELLTDEQHWKYNERATFDVMSSLIANAQDSVSSLKEQLQQSEARRIATLAHAEASGEVKSGLCAGDQRADILQQRLDDFRRQSQEEYRLRKTDLKRVLLYVDNAASGEYGYRDSEGHLCVQLLEKWGGGNASDPSMVKPQSYSEAKRILESAANAFAQGDLLLDSHGAAIAVKDMTLGGVDETDDASKHTALGEITAVLWFLTSLALDHEPLCAIKQGGDAKCDCDKLIPDGDAWAKRVRAALQLPGKINKELKETRDQAAHAAEAHSLEQKARLTAVATALAHSKRLKEYEKVLTDVVAEHDTAQRALKLEDEVVAYVSDLKTVITAQTEKLKHRRVIQAKPIGGASVPGGVGTVYELPLDDNPRVLVVVKGPVRGLPQENYYRWADEIHKVLKQEFGSAVIGVVMDVGMELTLLELP